MSFSVIEVKYKDKEYSKLLGQIHDPPEQLYCRGNIKLLNTFCFGVVGTRKLTAYGKEATEKIVSGLAGSGMTIVSGLAMGIDAVAHQTALDNDLPTIAVLGSTVDDSGIGPQVNFNLAHEILKNKGLLISEYAKRLDVHKSNFAIRDRIISGLSKGVLVVEGAEKSGSLITARSAADQNRDVFAVPGSIFNPLARGTNWLLKQGAKLVTMPSDILEGYGISNSDHEKRLAKISDPVQKAILACLDEHGILSVDGIISASGSGASEVNIALAMLEIQGQILSDGRGKYRRV